MINIKDIINTNVCVEAKYDNDRLFLLEYLEKNYLEAKWQNGEKPTKILKGRFIFLEDINHLTLCDDETELNSVRGYFQFSLINFEDINFNVGVDSGVIINFNESV
jgi:hypothetical protein